jgi:hypothetical protein
VLFRFLDHRLIQRRAARRIVDEPIEGRPRPGRGTGIPEEAHGMVRGEDDAVDVERDLADVDVGAHLVGRDGRSGQPGQ